MRPAIFGRHLVTSVVMLLGLTLVLGFGYPLVVTGLSQLFFHQQANGSLLYRDGKLVGSALLGQSFTDSKGNPLLVIRCTLAARTFVLPGNARLALL